MIRRALIATAAIAVAIFTLVGINRDLTEAPTFKVTTHEYPSEFEDFAMACQPIGAAAFEEPVWIAAPERLGFDRPSITSEQFQAVEESESKGAAWPNLEDPDQYAQFDAAIRENTDYACAIARENQQAKLVQTIGIGILGLMLVGIAGIVTLPRPRNATARNQAPTEEGTATDAQTD